MKQKTGFCPRWCLVPFCCGAPQVRLLIAVVYKFKAAIDTSSLFSGIQITSTHVLNGTFPSSWIKQAEMLQICSWKVTRSVSFQVEGVPLYHYQRCFPSEASELQPVYLINLLTVLFDTLTPLSELALKLYFNRRGGRGREKKRFCWPVRHESVDPILFDLCMI